MVAFPISCWHELSRAPVKKAVMGLARSVASPVEKAVGELEKAMAGWRRGGERGRWVVERHDGEGGRPVTMLSHCGDAARQALDHRGECEAAWRSTIIADRNRSSYGDFSRE
jgi:hypothetical protein